MKMVHLQEDVSTIMDSQNQGPDPGQVAGPGEGHESDGGHVMDEHLPEVLPLHVEKLKKRSQSLKTVEWNLVSQKLE